jgi:hypothetical protein
VPSVDWSKALDLEHAAKNLRSEFIGDWYIDPWAWPELNYLLKPGIDEVIAHLNGREPRRVAPLDVPKENWGSRPGTRRDKITPLVHRPRPAPTRLPWVRRSSGPGGRSALPSQAASDQASPSVRPCWAKIVETITVRIAAVALGSQELRAAPFRQKANQLPPKSDQALDYAPHGG